MQDPMMDRPRIRTPMHMRIDWVAGGRVSCFCSWSCKNSISCQHLFSIPIFLAVSNVINLRCVWGFLGLSIFLHALNHFAVSTFLSIYALEPLSSLERRSLRIGKLNATTPARRPSLYVVLAIRKRVMHALQSLRCCSSLTKVCGEIKWNPLWSWTYFAKNTRVEHLSLTFALIISEGTLIAASRSWFLLRLGSKIL